MAKLVISRSFLSVLLNLPENEQKLTLHFIDEFQAESRRPGVNLEPIKGSRDPRLRTARVSDNYRAVLWQPTQGDNFVLVWLDTHDKAYQWGERNVFSDAELEISIPIVNIQSRAARKGLFESVSDEALLEIGVPFLFLNAIKGIKTDSQLDSLKAFLPAALYEDLFYLTIGENVADIINRREKERELSFQRQFGLLEAQESAEVVKTFSTFLKKGQMIKIYGRGDCWN
ncbi:MAG: hypothetical protein QHH14_13940 [Clostridiales bacterium]|nr:hypothetical protein [Clostridiales bacterium]